MKSICLLIPYEYIMTAKSYVRNAGTQEDTLSMCVYDVGNKSLRVRGVVIFPKPSCARLVQFGQFERNTLKLMSGSGTRQRLRLLTTNRVVQSDPDHPGEGEPKLNPSSYQFCHYHSC